MLNEKWEADFRQNVQGQEYRGSCFFLGMDNEILLSMNGDVIWPHENDCPQERPTNGNSKWLLHKVGDVHGDGFAWEVCYEPHHCIDVMTGRIGQMLSFIKNALRKQPLSNFREGYTQNEMGLGYGTPIMYEVPLRTVRQAPAQVQALGCAPSINVYKDPAQPTSLGRTTRTLGCHLHLSHPIFDSAEVVANTVKWADLMVGNTWTALFSSEPDMERIRRNSYGRAGEYRATKYPSGKKGVEYRVLPGSAADSPIKVSLMYSLFRSAAMVAYTLGEPPADLLERARAAINQSDKWEARAVIKELDFPERSAEILNFYAEQEVKPLSLDEWQTHYSMYSGWGYAMAHYYATGVHRLIAPVKEEAA